MQVPHLARARFDCLRDVAPFDILCLIALMVLPTAWKVLSLDFQALESLCDRAPLFTFAPEFLFRALTASRCEMFSRVPVYAIQGLTALTLVLFVIWPRRLLLAPAIALLWILDTSAFLFRGTLYTLDTPLALLVIIFLTPVQFKKAIGRSLEPNADARLIALAALCFVSAFYVLAGAAKLAFAWDWPFVVRIGNYYPISNIWHSQEMPPIIDHVARAASEFFLANPAIDIASAIAVLVEQFLWLLAPFALLIRVHAGIFAVLYHVVVALTTGIVFITWPFIALAVTVPFSLIARRLSRLDPYALLPVSPPNRAAVVACVALPVALAVFPSSGKVYPPFHNYYAFGWRYESPEEAAKRTIYRVGWRDDATGELHAFPLNQGGFFDFRQTAMMDVYSRLLLSSSLTPDVEKLYLAHLQTLIAGTRGIGANGWLLGSFRSPEHLLALPGDVDMREIDTFYLMKGKPLPKESDRPLKIRWSVCAEMRRAPSEGEEALSRLASCHDGTTSAALAE